LGYISTLSGVIAIGGMPERRVRKHEKLEPPRAIVCFYEDFNRAKNYIRELIYDRQIPIALIPAVSLLVKNGMWACIHREKRGKPERLQVFCKESL
jgi:hypothetical protein